eukprot:Mrub_10804.p1 GENE.Mrub_10804~~Mrub_10804.p1  ORF type:complete len:217 (-),score=20.84 Mrub_10804:7-612(-)
MLINQFGMKEAAEYISGEDDNINDYAKADVGKEVIYLKAEDFGQEGYLGDINSFLIKNNYIFSKQLFELPIKIKFDFKILTENSEFQPCFSFNKKEWDNSDALSWYMATDRSDFTFRTRMFGGFPYSVRSCEGFICEVGKMYKMKCIIFEDKAEYFINGKPYASCKLNKGDIPSKGYIGFAVYNKDELKVVSNVRVHKYYI